MTNYYVYDGEKPVLEYDSSGAVLARNLYGKGIDEILMRVDVTNNWTLYYQQDHEGSTTHLTNAAGTVIEKYRYDVFGLPTYMNGSGGVIGGSAYTNRFLFTGREYRSTFGFYEYRARAYHPGLGRFMSEDPKLFDQRMGAGHSAQDAEDPAASDPLHMSQAAAGWSFAGHSDEAELNLFRYCGNDPLNYTDPTGEVAQFVLGAFYGALSGFGSDILLQGAENLIEGRSAFANINYGAAFKSAGFGAVTGAIPGTGVIRNTKQVISAAKKMEHARRVVAARKAAEQAGKFRNAARTLAKQQEIQQHAKDAAAAAARGAAAPLIKRVGEEVISSLSPPKSLDYPPNESK